MKKSTKAANVRKHISVVGARQNNLKNLSVDIPRDVLTVVTGVSGSGKSSLAFEVIYAEGQRRFLDSISTFARRRIQQVKRADVDFVYGLSPVVAIEQKKSNSNPRSTVGTMTDINDYMRVLFASCGTAHCPYCGTPFDMHSAVSLADLALSLPKGTSFRLLAPVYKIYGEDYNYLFDEIRRKGYKKVRIDGQERLLTEEIELEEHLTYRLEVVVDNFTVTGEDQYKVFTRSLESGFKMIGNGFLRIDIDESTLPHGYSLEKFYQTWGCKEHHVCMVELHPYYFSFNDSDSACRTCTGLGVHKQADPSLMIVNGEKSLNGGALISTVYNTNGWSYKNVIIYSLAKHYGFSLDAPFNSLPDKVKHVLFHGSDGEKITMVEPEDKKNGKKNWISGRCFAYGGFCSDINHWYKRWMEKPVHDGVEENFLNKVMVEYSCPDCKGTKLKPQRQLVKIDGKNISELSLLPLPDLKDFLLNVNLPKDRKEVGGTIIKEIVTRLDLLLDIGLYYISLDRRSDTLSGGEAQRIRLSTQISSGLMGMLYVLDEPSIGLHARDSMRIVNTIKRLRDIGNTVIVVEHDLDTMRHADHLVEIGPGPGIKGGQLVAQGTPEEVEASGSLTGNYLSGSLVIPLPKKRRPVKPDNCISILGAGENNLKDIDVDIPLGVMVCVTGVSGSGKSTLIHDILFKRLQCLFHDPRVRAGKHTDLLGYDRINTVINIDQSPIGRNSRSTPATYVGFYDRIRLIFSRTDEAVERGLTDKDFSYNTKSGGRCEECLGEGIIVRELQFMADIETVCPVCGGARYAKEILEVKYNGKNISEVLDMSIDEAIGFFADEKYISHKLKIMEQLGLGYLKLGQSSTTLSGGEAQRIKLATELGKLRRGANNLYILDEPTTGLHLADIQLLMNCLNKLVDFGHSVLVIEHHMDVIKSADYVIDLGPEGGKNGGNLMACGSPEEIAAVEESLTGYYLKELL